MDEAAAAIGAVDGGRVADVSGNGHAAREKDHGPERHPLPDVGDDVGAERQPPMIEPDRTVDAERHRQRAIDQRVLTGQHPADRDAGLNGRQHPGQQIDNQQQLDPPLRTHEKSGQQ